MIIRNIEEIKGSEREVTAENNNCISRRLLLKRDGVGFSLHETINGGTETYIWYKNHVEAVY
jgi:L-ectoine synthase